MTSKPSSKRASQKQLQSLKDHWEEETFELYDLLYEDCKRHFIDCLDGRSLVRLGMCSKAEQRLTAGIPLKIYGIKLSHGKSHISGGLWKTEKVQTKLDGGDQYCTYFNKVGTSVLMKTGKGHLLDTHENAENFKEAVAFFEDLLNKCNYGVEEIILNMGAEMREWAERVGSGIGNFPNVRVVGLYEMDSIHQKYWLQKVPEHLERLHLNEATSEIAELPHFRNVRRLICGGRCDVTDAQLLELNAVDVILDHAPLITPEGINVFLKRWQCGGGVDGFRKLKIKRMVQVEDVLEGLDALKVEKNNPDKSYYSLRNKVRSFEYLKFWSDSEGIDAQVLIEAPSTKKTASPIELLSLKDHFKDVLFHEYHLINQDCKIHLMECLDHRSLLRIGRCSKAEQLLAAGVPFKVSKIKMWNGQKELDLSIDRPNTKIQITFEQGDQFCVVFQQIEKRVTVKEKERVLWEYSSSEHSKKAEEFLENLLKKCRGVELLLESNPLTCLMVTERDLSEMGRLCNVRTAELVGMYGNYRKFWFEKMPDFLESLVLENEVTSEEVENSRFRTAHQITCGQRCLLTDNQLLRLCAVDISIYRAPLLTAHGVNVFFKRWQQGGGVDGFRRLSIWHIGDEGHNGQLSDIIKGLEARKVDDCSGVITCYAIPSKVNSKLHIVIQSNNNCVVTAGTAVFEK